MRHPGRALIAAKVRILPVTVYETVANSDCRQLPTKTIEQFA